MARDMLKTGVAWLDKQRKAHMSSPAVYRRAGDFVSIRATTGTAEYEQENPGDGISRSFNERDFLVSAADLLLSGAPVEPQRGDRIDVDGKTYEVNSDGAAPPWEWSDRFQTVYRIHTKEVL